MIWVVILAFTCFVAGAAWAAQRDPASEQAAKPEPDPTLPGLLLALRDIRAEDPEAASDLALELIHSGRCRPAAVDAIAPFVILDPGAVN